MVYPQPQNVQPTKVAICASHAHRQWGPRLAESCLENGLEPILVEDGAIAGLSAHCLLLVGSLRSLGKYRNLLAGLFGRRPLVVAWQWEPLLPVKLDQRVEKIGLAISASRPTLNKVGLLHKSLSGPFYYFLSRLHNYNRKGKADLLSSTQLKFALESYAYLYYGYHHNWIDSILVNNHQKREFLFNRGMISEFVPFGSQPDYGEDLHIPRDIDVLFLGSVRRAPFRRARLRELSLSLQKRGIRLVTATKGYYGDERTRLINRSKLMLQLHKYPWDLPTMRWCLASACGALIVSEPVANPEPFKPNVDYISDELESMPDVIEDIVADENRRKSMVISCQQRIRSELSYDRSMRYIASLIKSHCVPEQQNDKD